MGPIPTTPSSGPQNPEKRASVSQNQKAAARLERVEKFIQANPKIFARQGTVAPTWRTYRGKRLGPYYQLAYRDQGRQHWLYLGRSKKLARKVRELLDNLHHPRDQRRLSRRLQTQVRSSLRRATAHLKKICAQWGINLKGFEFRGIRKGLAHSPFAQPPHDSTRALGDSPDLSPPPESGILALACPGPKPY